MPEKRAEQNKTKAAYKNDLRSGCDTSIWQHKAFSRLPQIRIQSNSEAGKKLPHICDGVRKIHTKPLGHWLQVPLTPFCKPHDNSGSVSELGSNGWRQKKVLWLSTPGQQDVSSGTVTQRQEAPL